MKIKSIEISGVKSIVKPFKLQFLNKTNNSIKDDEATIKLIYGPNGSGKTAIIEAIKLYRSLVTTTTTLFDGKEIENIERIYNNRSDAIMLKFEYYFESYSFAHTIELKKIDQSKYRIIYEELTNMTKKGGELPIFKFDGKEYNIDGLYQGNSDESIEGVLQNRTGENSIINILYNHFLKLSENALLSILAQKYNLNEFMIVAVLLQDSVIVSEQKDKNYFGIHTNYNTSAEKLRKAMADDKWIYANDKIFFQSDQFLGLNDIQFSADIDLIDEKRIIEYKHEIKRLTSYLQIFKPNLLKIDIKESISENKLNIVKTLVYDYGKVSITNESVGIKKAVELFNVFANPNNKLVIIDELDAHFHDFLLTKLLEYIRDYTNIQLIATTHNALNMDAVKKLKHSISVLDLDGNVIDWKNSGNYSPSSLYTNNLLRGINFGYDEIDFLELFELRENNEKK